MYINANYEFQYFISVRVVVLHYRLHVGRIGPMRDCMEEKESHNSSQIKMIQCICYSKHESIV